MSLLRFMKILHQCAFLEVGHFWINFGSLEAIAQCVVPRWTWYVLCFHVRLLFATENRYWRVGAVSPVISKLQLSST